MKIRFFLLNFALVLTLILALFFSLAQGERTKIMKNPNWAQFIQEKFPLSLNVEILGEVRITSPSIAPCGYGYCGEKSQDVIFTADFKNKSIDGLREQPYGGIKMVGRLKLEYGLLSEWQKSKNNEQILENIPSPKINFIATTPITIALGRDDKRAESNFQELVYELEKRGFQNFPIYNFSDEDLCHFGRLYNPKTIEISEQAVMVNLEIGDISVKCLKLLF